ncbi:MAG TPA: hypothetical protein VD994_06245 [Prosthecobacter sp.]|nr:hypothetical protein [Prosthecobacter sp.]
MILEKIDSRLRDWSFSRSANERSWPVLIPSATLRRAGYHQAFPHLLMSTAVVDDPAANDSSLRNSGYDLSPAVCYHAYASLEGQKIQEGIVFAARGHCFRNEDPAQLKPGRRQIEFQMRELIFVGDAAWLEEQLKGVESEVAHLAQSFNLEGGWEAASDPFFLPQTQARGKAALQKLLGTKQEYCLPDGLAISSINRHRTFFGERFDISLPGGKAVHSACVAFGLDRWAAHAQPQVQPHD